jgi:hypothetical protein
MFKRNATGAGDRREIALAEGGGKAGPVPRPQGSAVAFAGSNVSPSGQVAALVKLEKEVRLNHVPAAFAFFRPLFAGDRFRHPPR